MVAANLLCRCWRIHILVQMKIHLLHARALPSVSSPCSCDCAHTLRVVTRLPDPKKYLRDMHVVVKPGGVFVLISPYSWLPEYTKQGQWIGGFTDQNGKGGYGARIEFAT